MKINPVVEKELKTTMRGWRAPLLISLYLGFLLLVIYLYFLANDQLYTHGLQSFNPRVAINAFNTLAFFQLLLLLFITPILTGGAISSERERQTLDLLLCTSFSTYKVVLGKIFVSIANILLLITASLPIMGIVFMFGGVEISNLILLFFFYIITALMLGSLGVFYSTIFKKTIVSIVMSYLTIGLLTFGTYIIMALFYFFFDGFRTEPKYHELVAFLFANPLFGFGTVIEETASNSSVFGALVILSKGDFAAKIIIKSWMINLGFDVLFSALLIFLSARRLKHVK
ncbi:MAG: ABC transporter permease subunit [Clostridiaceae bacterium]|jgi:ABC-2 type transport system permease protein|nr:ABC transporter permease subunit [Clostridiaceae bacterium]